MKNIYIVSGFIGAGKTSIIKTILKNYLNTDDCIVLNNELSDTNLDTEELKKYNKNIMEVKNGCLCCDYKEKFPEAINELINRYDEKNIIIETSGVELLSNMAIALKKFDNINIKLICVINSNNFESLLENYGVFYIDQLKNSEYILINQIEEDKEKFDTTVDALSLMNSSAKIIKYPFEENALNCILSSDDNIEEIEKEHSKHGCNPDAKLFYTDFITVNNINFTKPLTMDFIKELDEFFYNLNQDFLIDLPRAKGIVDIDGENFILDYIPYKIQLTKTDEKNNYLNVICSALEKNKVINYFKHSFYC